MTSIYVIARHGIESQVVTVLSDATRANALAEALNAQAAPDDYFEATREPVDNEAVLKDIYEAYGLHHPFVAGG